MPQANTYHSIGEIKAAYARREPLCTSTKQAIMHIISLFPCLDRLYPDGFDPQEWDPRELARRSMKMCEGELECVRFVLMVWNWNQTDWTPPRRANGSWKRGYFRIAEAVTHWGPEEKKILKDWIDQPFFL